MSGLQTQVRQTLEDGEGLLPGRLLGYGDSWWWYAQEGVLTLVSVGLQQAKVRKRQHPQSDLPVCMGGRGGSGGDQAVQQP